MRMKKDRCHLMYIAKASKPSQQLCQLRVDLFDLPEQSLQVMRDVVDRLIADPYVVRDEIMKNMGVQGKRRKITGKQEDMVIGDKAEAKTGEKEEAEGEDDLSVFKRPASQAKARLAPSEAAASNTAIVTSSGSTSASSRLDSFMPMSLSGDILDDP